MLRQHVGRLARRLLILFVLGAGLAATASNPSVREVKAFTTCEEDCFAAYEDCRWCVRGGQQSCEPNAWRDRMCMDRYLVCVDGCPSR